MTFSGFIQTQDGLHQTRFTATALAYYGNGFTILDFERYIIDCPYKAGVSKTKAPELKPYFQGIDRKKSAVGAWLCACLYLSFGLWRISHTFTYPVLRI